MTVETNNSDLVKSALFGLAIADSLGVPVEFKSREFLKQNPIVDMIGYGTHDQPPGTWSDDSSLTFCLAEALIDGYDINTIAQNFIKWLKEGYWASRGEVFDIGNSTRTAILNLKNGVRPDLAGGIDPSENGNGSLMRILPLVFYIKNKEIDERYRLVKEVSSITHGHIRSVISCFYYLEYARLLISGKDKFDSYQILKELIPSYLNLKPINLKEVDLFSRLLNEDIQHLPEENISSSGYVIHTLEASVWCILTTTTYKEAVLKAVNLGSDTDTTSAVTGGLAGLIYGFESIPIDWVSQLARLKSINDLANRFSIKCSI